MACKAAWYSLKSVNPATNFSFSALISLCMLSCVAFACSCKLALNCSLKAFCSAAFNSLSFLASASAFLLASCSIFSLSDIVLLISFSAWFSTLLNKLFADARFLDASASNCVRSAINSANNFSSSLDVSFNEFSNSFF